MFNLKVRVLEANNGEFQGKKYSNILARYGDKIMKFKLSSDIGDCKQYVDQDVEIQFEIVKNFDGAASLRVVSVSN